MCHCMQLAKQHTSSFSALPVLEWCLLCECFLRIHTSSGFPCSSRCNL